MRKNLVLSLGLVFAAGHFLIKIHNLDGGHGSLITLVPGFYTGPVQRLFDRIGCNNAENNRDACLQRCLCYPARGLARDVIEMRSLTTDDHPDRDDSVEVSALSSFQRRQRQFE